MIQDKITVSEFGEMVDDYLRHVSKEDFLKAIRKAKKKVKGGGLEKYLKEFSRISVKEEDCDELWFTTISEQWYMQIKKSVPLEHFILRYPQKKLSPIPGIGFKYRELPKMESEEHKIDRALALST